ncbi:cupredoxin domain-containing protein [Nostoc punctiforme FACHB-252]|uniref:Cupredoxin domain-containing protein n=1 Tax=Nostoc punctiforme FACHB-252 TaxID=1357509 RepID=A0ABR8HDZ8_NOSPU|nr:cupredoxin domain-containing protein [Nostoc punctiforme]MBD2613931.1 cupredoxin domain-containing protein [Nostoc punctiforme FACHB-252]
MVNKTALIGSIASLGIVLSIASGEAAAQKSHDTHSSATVQTNQFQRIEQPLENKIAVTLGGLGLLGLQLWWFLLSKPKSQKAVATGGNVQEVTVTVDGGYDPSRIVVKVGKPVRLKFERKDPSSCLEQVVIPDFHIAADLPLNQVTTVEFTPKQAGTYLFTCGMNMFRGEIQAEASDIQSTVIKEEKTMKEPQPKSFSSIDEHETTVEQRIQKTTINVDKGYAPNHVIVQAGQRVQLNFLRENPSNCLAKVLIPDFGIAADLPVNQLTSIEFTPEKPGEYGFSCGMNMFRGAISVQAADASEEKVSTQIHFS